MASVIEKAVYKIGSSGTGVTQLQTALKNAGYNIDVDGQYGPQTANAVKQYQTAKGLTIDGVAGSQTLGSLYGSTPTPTNKISTYTDTGTGNKDLLPYTNTGTVNVAGKITNEALLPQTGGGEKFLEYLDTGTGNKSSTPIISGLPKDTSVVPTNIDNKLLGLPPKPQEVKNVGYTDSGSMPISGGGQNVEVIENLNTGNKIVGGGNAGGGNAGGATTTTTAATTTNTPYKSIVGAAAGIIRGEDGEIVGIEEDWVNRARAAQGLPALTPKELAEIYTGFGLQQPVDPNTVDPNAGGTGYGAGNGKLVDTPVPLTPEQILAKMKSNSTAWLTATPEEQARLSAENEAYGKSMGWTKKNGVWYKTDGTVAYSVDGQTAPPVTTPTSPTTVGGQTAPTVPTTGVSMNPDGTMNQIGAYVSPYEAQLQTAIDNIIANMNNKFSYDPNTDPALQQAQKQAVGKVREDMIARGGLYSSVADQGMVQAAASLIPEYYKIAYGQYQDESERLYNFANFIQGLDSISYSRVQDQIANDFMVAEYNYQIAQDELDMIRNEEEKAWKRVELLGYVDNESALILGLDPNTPSYETRIYQRNREDELDDQQTQINANWASEVQRHANEMAAIGARDEAAKTEAALETELNEMQSSALINLWTNIYSNYMDSSGMIDFPSVLDWAKTELKKNPRYFTDLLGAEGASQFMSGLLQSATEYTAAQNIAQAEKENQPTYKVGSSEWNSQINTSINSVYEAVFGDDKKKKRGYTGFTTTDVVALINELNKTRRIGLIYALVGEEGYQKVLEHFNGITVKE